MLFILLNGIKSEVYNIANPNSIATIAQYAQILANIANINLKFEYIQFVSTNNINMCLAIDESGLFALKSCSDYLNNKKFETVFKLIHY